MAAPEKPALSLDLVRASIRQVVAQHGHSFKRAAPSVITISLVGAALLPVALGTLPITGPVVAMLGLAGGVGQGLIGNWITEFTTKIKQERLAKSITEDEIRSRLENELKAHWEAGGAGANGAAWRMEMSQVLQRSGGADTALAVASGEVKQSLAQGFESLSAEFKEFGWLMSDMAQTLADIREQHSQELALLREILQGQQENAAQAGVGLQALGDLLHGSAGLRDALYAFRADFQAAVAQVDVLGDYKDLHDLLHRLQYDCYNVIIKAATRFPADETALDDLQDYLVSLEDILGQLHAVVKRAAVTPADTGWVADVASARDDLQACTDAAGAKPLKQAIWRLNRTLSIQPTRINTRLTEAARALRLPALVEGLTRANAQLAAPGLDPDKVRQFQAGLEALDRLSQNLSARVETHDRWQGVDVELRRIDALIEQDLTELQMSWPDLKVMAEPLLQAQDEEWAVGLLKEAEALDEALATDNPVKTRRAFRNYRNRAGHRFFQVDSDLRRLCGELRPIGEPLTVVLRLIE
jgi:hypothetical protein